MKGADMANCTVKQGDCLSSIGFRHGFRWQTLWDHPQNAGLKEKRKDPNVLYPGDSVFIPDKEERWESCDTGNRHRFVMKGIPEELNLVLKREGVVLANTPYTLDIDGTERSGTTDGEGRIREKISPDAKQGRLIVGEGEDQLIYELFLGHMDPVDQSEGLAARLKNLGFDCGDSKEAEGPGLVAALRVFQTEAGLEPTGEVDEKTRDALKQNHGK